MTLKERALRRAGHHMLEESNVHRYTGSAGTEPNGKKTP